MITEPEVVAWIATQSHETIDHVLDAILERVMSLGPCQHGTPAGDYCEPCNQAYQRSRLYQLFKPAYPQPQDEN